MRKLINLFLVIATAVSLGFLCGKRKQFIANGIIRPKRKSYNGHGYIDEYSLGDE